MCSAGCGGVSEDTREELRAQAARVESDAEALDAARKAGIGALARAATLSASPCPESVIAVTRDGTSDMDGFRASMVDLDALEGRDGLRVTALREEAADILQEINGESRYRRLDEEAIPAVQARLDLAQSASFGRYEVTLVVTRRQNPVAHGLDLEPGQLTGRFFVWDYVDGSAVCSAEATVRSGSVELVDADGNPNHELAQRLEAELFESAARAAGLDPSLIPAP